MLWHNRRPDVERIAQVVEARFPRMYRPAQPELLAHHYTGADGLAQAVPYWQRAGQRAIERSAHVEAISHLTKGLELLTTLPDTAERTQHELDFLTALGPALMATKGYAAPEVVQAYTRARELCQQIGEMSEHFLILWNLWLFYLVRAEHQAAMELGEQFASSSRKASRTRDAAPGGATAGSRHVPVDRRGISTTAFSNHAGGGLWPPG